ncbi:MAG: hypothetical protein J6W64_06835 [Bacilli bacterium]|nr:hypothetical protein [Bacilli bacterium]
MQIKVKAIEEFTLEKFDEIKNLKRCSIKSEIGKIFINDEFECDKELCEYLLGKNRLNKPVVRLIEIDIK